MHVGLLSMEGMMRNFRDYQRTKSNPYILPENLYKQTLYQVRDYNRMKDELKEEPELKAIEIDGQPRGNGTGDPTSYRATKRAEYDRITKTIEEALKGIPAEFRSGVWKNILYNSPYPNDSHRSTYWRYKSKFIHTVAKKLFLA